MSNLYEKLTKKGILNRQSDSEDDEEEILDEDNDENKNPKPVETKKALRGSALSAALLASSDDESEESDEKSKKIGYQSYEKMAKNNLGKPTSGIYAQRLNQTKYGIKQNHKKMDKVDGTIYILTFNNH